MLYFSCFPSAILRTLQTFAHARPLTQCFVGTITQTGLKIFAITCRPGPKLTRSEIFVSVPGGGYFLVKDYWGCAAGWGRIFTSGLTIMGLHF